MKYTTFAYEMILITTRYVMFNKYARKTLTSTTKWRIQ